MVFFSTHGVPLNYVEDAGYPYKDQMEECISLIMRELKARGIENEHTLTRWVIKLEVYALVVGNDLHFTGMQVIPFMNTSTSLMAIPNFRICSFVWANKRIMKLLKKFRCLPLLKFNLAPISNSYYMAPGLSYIMCYKDP